MLSSASSVCHCGSARPLAQCCDRFIAGGEVPATAEQLMRSRYSAYVIGARDYLLATWHPSTRPTTLELDAQTKWLGLEVKAHAQQDADHATVEFVARYRVAGKGHRLHEASRFERVAGRWLYVDGSFKQSKQFLK
ncbi:MAG: YchJ family protein [Burkholderiaceae bacterium]